MQHLNGRQGGMRNSRSSLQENRRSLKTCPDPLNYNMQPDDVLEFEVKYVGDIKGIPLETDITNRTDVLKILDRGKKHGVTPHEGPVIFTLCKSSIKVTTWDRAEQELLTVPINEIAAMCYIKEEGIHILSVKHGSPDSCNLGVLYCASQETAEGICSLVGQCFQLLYTNVMIELIEDTIDRAISGSVSYTGSSDSTTKDEIEPWSFEGVDLPEDFSGSATNIPPYQQPNKPRPPQSDISRTSRNSTESTQAELLRDFMWQLQRQLKPEELLTFKSLLDNYYTGPLGVRDFCDELFNLYGYERKRLLAGMFPFIKDSDCPYFETFLRSHDISAQGTLNSRIYTRSVSDISLTGNVGNDSELDHFIASGEMDMDSMLDEFGKKMEHIAVSVGDPAEQYLS